MFNASFSIFSFCCINGIIKFFKFFSKCLIVFLNKFTIFINDVLPINSDTSIFSSFFKFIKFSFKFFNTYSSFHFFCSNVTHYFFSYNLKKRTRCFLKVINPSIKSTSAMITIKQTKIFFLY